MPTRLSQLHLKNQTHHVRSNNQKHQVLVAYYHAEVLTESADHCSDKVCPEVRGRAQRPAESRGEDQAGKKYRQRYNEKRPQ